MKKLDQKIQYLLEQIWFSVAHSASTLCSILLPGREGLKWSSVSRVRNISRILCNHVPAALHRVPPRLRRLMVPEALRRGLRVGMALLLCLFSPSPGYLQTVPTLINFQGRLTDSSNNPLTGDYNFVFRICDSLAGDCSSPLWTETQNNVTVTNGVLAVQLGASTDLTSSVFSGTTAYLEIVVAGETFDPRERLIASPYAFNSQLLKGRHYEALVSTDATQTIGGAKTFSASTYFPGSGIWKSDGNVGIGTTEPSGPGGADPILHISGTKPVLTFSDTDVADIYYLFQSGSGLIFYNANTAEYPIQIYGSGNVTFNDGNVGIGTTAPDGILHVSTGTASETANLFVQASDGNIGIGTTGPGATLHVYSTTFPVEAIERKVAATGANYAANRLVRSHDTGLADGGGISTYFGLADDAGTVQHAGAFGVAWSDVSAKEMRMVFMTRNDGGDPGAAGYQRMVIDGTGNVGIGTTGPTEGLDLDGTNPRLHIAQAAAPGTTTDKLYNVGGELLWNGVDLSGAGALPAATEGYTLRGEGSVWESTSTLFIKDGGNVGIGTTGPSYKLSIGSTDGSDQIGIYHDNTNAHFKTSTGAFRFQSDEAGVETMFQIVDNGVGSVTLQLRNNTNDVIWQIAASDQRGLCSAAGASAIALSMQSNADIPIEMFRWPAEGETPELQIYGYRTGDAARNLQIGVGVDAADTASFDGVGNYYFDGNVGIGTTDPSGIFDVLDGTFTVLSSGNVGIGTTDPGKELHVVGEDITTIAVERNSNDSYTGGFVTSKSRGTIGSPSVLVDGDYIGDITMEGYDGFFYRTGAEISAKVNGTPISGQMPADLIFLTNRGTITPTERMRIDKNGNVGINDTGPDALLEVKSNAAASGYAVLVSSQNDTTGMFVVQGDGNVGIGTTGPGAKLHVLGTTGGADTWTEGILVENNNATAAEPTVAFKNSSTGANYWFTGLNQSADYDLAYGATFTNAVTKMRIQTDGNVGINTVAPGAKLHVNGITILESSVTVGGTQGALGATADDLTTTGTSFFGTGGSYKVTNGGLATVNTVFTDLINATSEVGYSLTFQKASGSSYNFAWTTGTLASQRLMELDDAGQLTTKGGMVGSGQTILAIDSGNVGIGTTDPAEKLDVSGNIATTGTIIPDNACGITGGMMQYERGTTASNSALAMGNGQFPQGGVSACTGQVTAITGMCGTADGSNHVALQLRLNGSAQAGCETGEILAANTGYTDTSCGQTFASADRIGCYTKTLTGAPSTCVCIVYMRFD